MSSTSIVAVADCAGVISYTVIPHDVPEGAEVRVLEVWTTAPGGLGAAAPGTWQLGANVTINGKRYDSQTSVTVPDRCQVTTTTRVEETTTTTASVSDGGPTPPPPPSIPGTVESTTTTTEWVVLVPPTSITPPVTLPRTGAGMIAPQLGLVVACLLGGALLTRIARRKGVKGFNI
jgi:hypothetical protein